MSKLFIHILFTFLILIFGLKSEKLYSQIAISNNVTPFNKLSDSIKAKLYDFAPDFSNQEIKLRLDQIQGTIPLSFNKKVRSFVDFFTIRNREYSKMVIKRQHLYFPIFEKILKENGMPDELKYLSVVESGLNPTAKSPMGAVGLWQFVPSTGLHYGLNRNEFSDDRMHVAKSTQAACEYISSLYKMFGEWHLALAAYNCGPGNVRKAIRLARTNRDFWAIYNYLPAETRSYVPQFIAIVYLMNFHRDHNIHPEFYEYSMSYDTLHVKGRANLESLCELTNFCSDDLKKLNPSLKSLNIPLTNSLLVLNVPTDLIQQIRENKFVIYDSTILKPTTQNEFLTLSNPKYNLYHRVKKGENLLAICRKYNVSVYDIKNWNNMESLRLSIGQKLVILVDKKISNKTFYAKANTKSTKKKISKKVYLVKPGDTLWTISQKYGGLPISTIRKRNKIKGNELKVGQKIYLS